MRIDGTKVVDASKKIILHVTPRDVKKGDNKDPASCAAAQACIRDLGASAARVHIGRTYVKINDKWIRYQTSKALRTEIVAFDRGGEFAAGEYALTPMKPSGRATGKTQGSRKKVRKTAPPKKRVKYHTVTGVRAHGANR